MTRLVLALAVLAVVETVTGSTRAGAVATVVYACNPQLLFFNSQFSYQSLALPLAVLTVYLFLTRSRGTRWSLALPLLALTAVSSTHHVTAGLLLVAFGIWWLIEVVLRRGRTDEAGDLAVMTLTGAALLTATVLNPGNTLGSYLVRSSPVRARPWSPSPRASSPSSCSRTRPGWARPPGSRCW